MNASAVPHTVVIPANTLSGTLALTAVQDLIDETNETVIVDIAIDMTWALDSPSWTRNGLHAINPASEPTNRCWYVPDTTGTSGFFRVRDFLK